MYWVYVLESETTGKKYTGQTSDLAKRLESHNQGEQIATKHGVPWKLVHLEKYLTRSEAMKREKYLKTGKGREEIQIKIGAWPSLV